jgi:hypothetical protein
MRKTLIAALMLVQALVLHHFWLHSYAQAQLTPTTTLTAETSNNTSTAASFGTQSNGNLGASNISKVDTRTLLYPGATTRIYAHLMPWFGEANHMNIGYRSDDPEQVRRQVSDMLSRGIQGVMIDWYGQGGRLEDSTTQAFMREAEARSGQFEFAVMYDGGALGSAADETQRAIEDLTYAYQTYQTSPAYMRINGRPVVLFFDADRYGVLDWNRIRSTVPGSPLFIFKDSGGFGQNQSDGSYVWVGLNGDPNYWGQQYYADFYSSGKSNPSKHTIAGTKKGFNDTLALWSKRRVVNQNCGQTWLRTFEEINKHYDSGAQLEVLQLVTWNDYEEGSELESGVDNCVSISASLAGSRLKWAIAGQENTLDHYTVFVSTDGENLAPLLDVSTGTHELDLSSFTLPAGNYTVYVKAVGKPSMLNHMSKAVSYTSAGAAAVTAGDFTVTPVNNHATVARGQMGSYELSVAGSAGFGGAVSLACSGLPAGMSCSFSPAVVAPGSSAAKVSLMLNAAATTASAARLNSSMFALWLPTAGVAGMVVAGDWRKRKRAVVLMLCVVMLLVLSQAGCGGAPSTSQQAATAGLHTTVIPAAETGTPPVAAPQPVSPGTSPLNFTVLATSGSLQRSTTLSVTLN